MKRRISSKRLLGVLGVLSAIVLALYLFGVGLYGWDNGETCTGIGLMLVAGEMLYLGKILRTADLRIMQGTRVDPITGHRYP